MSIKVAAGKDPGDASEYLLQVSDVNCIRPYARSIVILTLGLHGVELATSSYLSTKRTFFPPYIQDLSLSEVRRGGDTWRGGVTKYFAGEAWNFEISCIHTLLLLQELSNQLLLHYP